MKTTFRHYILFVLLALFSSVAIAQPLNRKADTKIVDALNQLPADNQALYNRLMDDIASTGNDGVEMLLEMLYRNDDSRTRVEYALDAYAAYAGQASFPADKRGQLKATLQTHLAHLNSQLSGNDAKDCMEKPWTVTDRELLVRMLRNLSPADAQMCLLQEAIPASIAPALKGSDRAARMGTIHSIQTNASESQLGPLLAEAEALLPKLKAEAQEDVLYWMGLNPAIANTANAKKLLKSKNSDVATAAAWAITRIGRAEDLPAVAALLKSKNKAMAEVADQCLRCYPGDVTALLENSYAALPAAKAIARHRRGLDIEIHELTPFEQALFDVKRSMPAAERLMRYREAMKMAANAEEQCRVLELVARVHTVPAALYCGEYLDNAATQQAAAQAIRVLTSGHNDVDSPEVRALMRRAKDLITGADAGYQKTEIQQQLDKLAAKDVRYELSAEEKADGFNLLFDGTNLDNFQGDFVNYHAEDGCIYVKPRGNGFGNLYTKEEYQDFVFRFEFKLTPGANNGIGVRAEMGKDAAYYGMEIQVLDHYNEIYQPGLRDYQYHGSVYGIIPTQNRDCLRPVGEWNEEEIYIKGSYVRVTLNGTVITEGDIKEATKNGTYDHLEHPGLFNPTGYIGFLGHGSELWFRHVRVKRL